MAPGSQPAAATPASGIRIVVFRLGHHAGSESQGAERCDGRDIEDDPHGRSPLRKPAVQVSWQELSAARVIELGLAPAVAGKSFECDFPASLAAALQTFAIVSGPNGSWCRNGVDHVLAKERARSSRKGVSSPRPRTTGHRSAAWNGFISRKRSRVVPV